MTVIKEFFSEYGSVFTSIAAIVTVYIQLRKYRRTQQRNKTNLQTQKDELIKKLSDNIQEQSFLLAEINNLEINSTRFLLISLSFLLAAIGVAQITEPDILSDVFLTIILVSVIIFFILAMKSSLNANRNFEVLNSVRRGNPNNNAN